MAHFDIKRTKFVVLAAVTLMFALRAFAQVADPIPTNELRLQLDSARSSARIALSGNFHTVEGSFALKRGALQYDPATGKTSGEIVFDAGSGRTGNDRRDQKMHKDVLESSRFPEISFRPNHAEGTFAAAGDSTLQVHGIFSIHGGDHELTIPVTVHRDGESWTATAEFQVPYVKWGMKNPSVLFLRVASFVDIRLHAEGSLR
jgi:polyisoprenoid-binding protein YceI